MTKTALSIAAAAALSMFSAQTVLADGCEHNAVKIPDAQTTASHSVRPAQAAASQPAKPAQVAATQPVQPAEATPSERVQLAQASTGGAEKPTTAAAPASGDALPTKKSDAQAPAAKAEAKQKTAKKAVEKPVSSIFDTGAGGY